ncbi:MAG: glycosyltransferase [Candidatus Pacebacteria bacterium]|nr:glycosyltransferase [Candidatus Paceibacterota bacterium]
MEDSNTKSIIFAEKLQQNNNLLGDQFQRAFKEVSIIDDFQKANDVFIPPSFEEVWGLVVNEALASGLYVLCSKYTGVAYDLINEESGTIFDPDNADEMVKLVQDTKNQIELIRSKRTKISNWAKDKLSIEKSVESFVLAIGS